MKEYASWWTYDMHRGNSFGDWVEDTILHAAIILYLHMDVYLHPGCLIQSMGRKHHWQGKPGVVSYIKQEQNQCLIEAIRNPNNNWTCTDLLVPS